MKIALVTGGSSGIGKEICLKIAMDHKCHVLVNYLSNENQANEVVNQIKQSGGTAEIIQFDVISNKSVTEALEKWWSANDNQVIEVLINNAGIVKDGLLVFMKESSWDKVVDTKLKGFYNVTQALLEKMLRNRNGRIVNIASLMGVYGSEGQVNYSAANGGLIAASKGLAREISKRNVTVNVIAPGYIESEMTADLPVDEIKQMIPIKRFGKAEEVADLVSFLVSHKASYITGEVIKISGGL